MHDDVGNLRRRILWMLDSIWNPVFDAKVEHKIPEEVEDAWDKAFEELNYASCSAFGHEIIEDMCRIPEHEYCAYCGKLRVAIERDQ